MPNNPPVQIGNVYESNDRREPNRQVRVLEEAVGQVGKWNCENIRNRQMSKLGDKILRERWKLISTTATDTLQELLAFLQTCHEDRLDKHTLRFRDAWVEAGCPGLRRS